MKPVLQALVLAERIYTDTTGKKIIAGTFNRLHVSKMRPPQKAFGKDGNEIVLMPAELPLAPSAYISLTDVCDNTDLLLQFVNLSKNKVLFETRMKVGCKDRLATIEIVTLLPNFQRLQLESGVYSFEIVCEGEVLGSHRVMVVMAGD